MNALQTIIDNYVNGNLSDAKKGARRFPHHVLRDHLVNVLGYSERKAALTADWLKGRDCWQAACDAE